MAWHDSFVLRLNVGFLAVWWAAYSLFFAFCGGSVEE